jgi:hypothetical protein
LPSDLRNCEQVLHEELTAEARRGIQQGESGEADGAPILPGDRDLAGAEGQQRLDVARLGAAAPQ